MAEEEAVKKENEMEGDFVYPNGDTFSGSYLSGPEGIKRHGQGKWVSQTVSKYIYTMEAPYFAISEPENRI